jgi:hypothetical protein
MLKRALLIGFLSVVVIVPAALAAIWTPISGEPTAITVNGVSAASTCPVGKYCTLVCDVDVYLEFGDTAPTADANSGFLPARTMIGWEAKANPDGGLNFAVKEYATGVGGTCKLQKWR